MTSVINIRNNRDCVIRNDIFAEYISSNGEFALGFLHRVDVHPVGLLNQKPICTRTLAYPSILKMEAICNSEKLSTLSTFSGVIDPTSTMDRSLSWVKHRLLSATMESIPQGLHEGPTWPSAPMLVDLESRVDHFYLTPTHNIPQCSRTVNWSINWPEGNDSIMRIQVPVACSFVSFSFR